MLIRILAGAFARYSHPWKVAAAVFAAGIFAAAMLAADRALAVEKPAAAKVYLFRGFMGIFSTGLTDLAADLNRRGIPSRALGHLSASSAGAEIREAFRKDRRSVRPLVLVGHSFGADAAMQLAKSLAASGIVVDLVVTVDPTSRGPLSTNVRRYVNYYLSDNMLGQAIGGEPGLSRRVTNIDLSARPEIAGTGTSHWTMTTNAIVAGEIRKNILRSVR